MKVRVQATDLRGYAGQLERNASYADAVWAYAEHATQVQVAAGGMLNLVCGGHERVRETVHSICVDLAGLLQGSGRRLNTAAGWYDRADEAAWQRIDKLNIDAPVRPAPRQAPGRRHGRYRDVADPRRRLATPTSATFPDPAQPLARVLRRYPAWLPDALTEVTGRNVVGELSREFLGDWGAWSRTGEVWEQIGWAMSDLARNVQHGNADLGAGWNGQAADAAYLYFARFAAQVGAQRETFEALKAGYDFYLAFAYTTASVLADFVGDLFDVLLATAADGSVAGPVGADDTARMTAICEQISQLLTAAHTTAGAVNALIIGRSRKLYAIREALPLKSYALKGVER